VYFDDVDLFSLRTIKNATNPNGIDMGTSENLEAVFVYTNILRMAINMKKAEIISKINLTQKLLYVQPMTQSHLKQYQIFIKNSCYN